MKDKRMLWLPAAIYRIVSDEETEPVDLHHLLIVFDDFPVGKVTAVVEALIEYGAITRDAHGDLWPVPVEEPVW